jgi:hypothetical protein
VTSSTLTYVGFGVVFASAVAWALIAPRHARRMTLPDAIAALTRRRAARLAVVGAWAWLGWHLFARGSGAFG